MTRPFFTKPVLSFPFYFIFTMNEPRMASRERKRARAKRTSLYILGTLMLRHGRVRRFVVWDMGHEIVRRVKRKKKPFHLPSSSRANSPPPYNSLRTLRLQLEGGIQQKNG